MPWKMPVMRPAFAYSGLKAFCFILAVLLIGPVGAETGADRIDSIIIGDSHRKLALRISYRAHSGKRPAILFSHGNRLSSADYDPLVSAWAAAGFIVIQPDHEDAPSRNASGKATPDAWRTRVADMIFALDHMDGIDDHLRPLGVGMDRSAIAAAGHSFGGHTAAALMGMGVRDPHDGALRFFDDRRIAAALLLAPPGGSAGMTAQWRLRAPYLDTDWAAMRGPVLILNGGRDEGIMSDAGPGWHNDAFTGSSAGTICLAILPDADHYFGGISRRLDAEKEPDPAMLTDVRRVTTDFFKATLRRRADRWKPYVAAAAMRSGMEMQCHANQ